MNNDDINNVDNNNAGNLAQNAGNFINGIPLNINNVVALSKIPEPFKAIPVYDGNEKTLHFWLRTVEDMLQHYIPYQQDPIYPIWFQALRAKIIGRANEALITRNTPNLWLEIRARLIEVFGDQRDISTLCQAISLLQQGKKTLKNFYEEVCELNVDISQKIHQVPQYAGHQNAVMHFVEMLTRNAFIDGMNEPYSSYTRNYRPETISAAYKAALAQQLAYERKKDKFSSKTGQRDDSQSSSSNRFQRGGNSQTQNRSQNFAQRSNNAGRDFQSAPRNLQQNVSRNFQQDSAPRVFQRQNANANVIANPTPMETDTSVRSRQSAVPMSISQRFARNNQIANVEEEDFANDVENSNENEFDDADVVEVEDLNFHLASAHLSIG